jgi:NAD(P)-dependent dehydrogenase (short-subunit alcohol dehydrogenase family)
MRLTALKTGASRGLGREVSRPLKAAGWNVFVTGRDRPLLESLQCELGCSGRAVDLAEAGTVLEMFTAAREALGWVDVLVNNAGFNRAKTPVTEITAEEFRPIIETNL